MAGAGYRLFNTGDVLTAAQVNNYLQEQVIMVFANSSARTSALSGVLAEGMASYLQDTNSFEIYNGSAWVSASGDLTGLTAGTGITITDPTGPVPTITNDVATEFDTKGDLIVGTGADTFDKLVAGSNGETLVADSAATTGLRWNPSPSVANPIINGAYDIAQRGTSFTTAGGLAYTLDRWISRTAAVAGSMVTTRETTGDTTNLPFIQYCARVRRTTSNSNINGLEFQQPIETTNSIPFVGRQVTFSFYARKSANFTGTFSALLESGTGTDQGLPVTFTGGATVAGGLTTLTATWARYTFTGTPSASATQLGIIFRHAPSGTAGADDYYEVTGVQIDLGAVALPFRRSGGTLQGELAACQRYYYETAPLANRIFSVGQAYSTTAAYAFYQNPVTMRGVPSASFSAAGHFDLFDATGSRLAVTALSGGTPNRDNIRLDATVASGLVAGNAAVVIDDAAGTAVIKVSAEL